MIDEIITDDLIARMFGGLLASYEEVDTCLADTVEHAPIEAFVLARRATNQFARLPHCARQLARSLPTSLGSQALCKVLEAAGPVVQRPEWRIVVFLQHLHLWWRSDERERSQFDATMKWLELTKISDPVALRKG